MPLIKPDYLQCQSEITSYHPFILGGKCQETKRCINQPIWLASEKESKDNEIGSMTLCEECKVVCEKQMKNKVTFKKLGEKNDKSKTRRQTRSRQSKNVR